jgi:ABC-type antimicrobial peptide transport system permease subunit
MFFNPQPASACIHSYDEPPIHATPSVDLWLPLVRYNPAMAGERGMRSNEVIGRLRPDVELDAAQAEMDVIAAGLSHQYPDTNRSIGAQLVLAVDEVTGGVSLGLWVLLFAVGALLLIACVNIANLFLARAQERRQEFVIRMALGGSRSRAGRQLLTEGVLISAAGGAAGYVLAYWAWMPSSRWLRATCPERRRSPSTAVSWASR